MLNLEPQKSLSSLFGRFTFTAPRITFVTNEPVACEPFCRKQVFIHTLMSAGARERRSGKEKSPINDKGQQIEQRYVYFFNFPQFIINYHNSHSLACLCWHQSLSFGFESLLCFSACFSSQTTLFAVLFPVKCSPASSPKFRCCFS